MTTTTALTKKIEDATKGLSPNYPRRLSTMRNEQASTICDYISAIKSEMKLSDNYRQSIINTLVPLGLVMNKGFKGFARGDVIRYLDRFRKEDAVDPTHKWIGTYNANLVNLVRFFKWLYYPKLGPVKRHTPAIVRNLRKLKRLEISGYKPSDMWNPEDNLLFLKYCPNARDKCYHSMEVDAGARPHELLELRIKDIEFVNDEADGGSSRYARIVLNGKTGERVVPLIDSIPIISLPLLPKVLR